LSGRPKRRSPNPQKLHDTGKCRAGLPPPPTLQNPSASTIRIDSGAGVNDSFREAFATPYVVCEACGLRGGREGRNARPAGAAFDGSEAVSKEFHSPTAIVI